jgi:hypothetical protein
VAVQELLIKVGAAVTGHTVAEPNGAGGGGGAGTAGSAGTSSNTVGGNGGNGVASCHYRFICNKTQVAVVVLFHWCCWNMLVLVELAVAVLVR